MTIKTITIPDVHGETTWRHVIPLANRFDKIVFLGDYADSFYHRDDEILQNLLKIIDFRKKHSGKVVLLLGNHDLHYIEPGNLNIRSTGFRRSMAGDLEKLFSENKEMFRVAFQIRSYLWTHAGLSATYVAERLMPLMVSNSSYRTFYENRSLDLMLNAIYDSPDRDVLNDIGRKRGGIHNRGGIFWADATETLSDPYPGWHQVVGHTKMLERQVIRFNESTGITYCETKSNENKFHELEIIIEDQDRG
ncbi:MAG: metallophosphoesterase [Bacteroidetes bacterium]|nr:metallophosphoesterase [Bacteroidota bacterium]